MVWTLTSDGDTGTSTWAQKIENALALGNPAQMADFIVFKDGSTYYARNGTDGTIDYSGTAAHTVINNAIDNSDVVALLGELTVTATVEVDDQKTLCGAGGTYHQETPAMFGAGLTGALAADYIVSLDDESKIYGLAIVNTNATGHAVKLADGPCEVHHCDIYAEQYGIHSNPTVADVEPKIYRNRLTSDGTAGGIGVYIQNTTDNEVHHNIIRGFETGIKIAKSTGFYSHNHIYKYPAATIVRGFHITAGTNRVINNYIEGMPTTAGIEDTSGNFNDYIGNIITVGSGADGIHFNFAGSTAITRCHVKHNVIQGKSGSNGDTAIEGTNVSGYYLSFIGENSIRYMDFNGETTQVVSVPFVDGTAADDRGWDIDAGGEYARAYAILPSELEKIRYIRIYAHSVVTEADAMRLEINMNGGADNEPYTTEAVAIADHASESTNFAANDVIYWQVDSGDDADIGHLTAGDSLEVKVLHEAAGGDDCQTDARFRNVEIWYY